MPAWRFLLFAVFCLLFAFIMVVEMKRKPFPSICLSVVLLIVVASLFAGCKRSTSDSTEPPTYRTQAQASPKPSPLTGFEKDLQFVRNGQYTYVWVFSRKDGKPLDKDDANYLRTNAPQVVDWVTTDEGRKVIAGTNFNLAEGNLNLLKKRFVAEDYSGKANGKQ
jgi:hypothetical protein